ncbi:bifunctional serine/threonine-protein kinase/ABC transporter substrate-binding protein [Spirillospora sp. CA-294931]|uniref:bifunctional serine/threonine-protein kinase/ABC transporter substrate-binding protein n=1 Tax=Spirillospora sp. CA-294931 TaxID=3240042 RepID=UPI003D92F0E1
MPDPLHDGDPARIGPYVLVERLGDGGQGVVFLARGEGGGPVAVKLLHAQLSGNVQARARFVRELELAERVAGFCTARVLDADIAGDRPYIVSEYVRGPSLKELVGERGALDARELTRLGIGTMTALAAIHQAGVVHRDFKPPNVLMGPDGPRVIDFGIARALDTEALTMTSQVVGTPAYMAPEQVGEGEVGPAADVFAWAATMLFAATGRPPFGGDSIPKIMHRILSAEPDVSALPAGLVAIVRACLVKDPGRRPKSRDVLAWLLAGVGMDATGDPLVKGTTLVGTEIPVLNPVHVTLPPKHRPKWPLAVGAAVMATALAVSVGFLIPQLRADGGKEPAVAKVKLAFLGPVSAPELRATKDMLAGAKAAVADHNAGVPLVQISLDVHDTKGDPAAAAAAASKIISGGYAGVIGPVYDSEAATVAPLLGGAKIPMVSPGAQGIYRPGFGLQYWHRVIPSYDTAVRALADFMAVKAKVKRAVVIEDENDWSAAPTWAVAQQLESKGAQVTRQRVQSTATDFGPDVGKLRDARPDAIFYGGRPETSGRLIAQARKAGVKARFYLTEQSFSGPLTSTAGQDADGTMVVCGCVDPASRERTVVTFAEKYSRFIGGSPAHRSPEGYDAATPLVRAVAAGRTTPAAINDHLRTVELIGAGQRLGFDPDGNLKAPVAYLYRVTGGSFTFLGRTTEAKMDE